MPENVWFNKNFSPIIHVIKEISPQFNVLATHTSKDSPMLYGNWKTLIEPSGVVGAEYLKFALNLVKTSQIQLFIPSKEASFLTQFQADFAQLGTRVFQVAEPKVLKHLEDKAAFYDDFPGHYQSVPQGLARVALTKVVQTWQEMQQAIFEVQSAGHLVCIKPAIGIYGYGFRIITKQERIKDFLKGDTHRMSMAQAEHLFKPLKQFPPMLVMEFLPGQEYSVDCLAKAGTLVGAVVREKVGGLGNVQEVCGSIAHPQIHQVVVELTSRYRLNGIFNIQFKNNRERHPCVLEINARPSGGLRFSMTTGFEFGLNMVRLELGLIKPEDIKPPSPELIRVTETKEALILL